MEDNGKVSSIISWIRIVTCFVSMMILGNPIKIKGAEYNNERATYISNYASQIDIFLIMWLIPTGIVGIAKKEHFKNEAIVI
ncbi:hypothetical protein HN51_015991 [Arachis hypogaea]